MMKRNWERKLLVLGLLVILSSTTLFTYSKAAFREEYLLPTPLPVDMMVEVSMFRRMSVRDFTNEAVTDDELSTILWAACGYQSNGGRTIAGINNTYSGIIYVLKEEAVYTYDPVNHSLVFFKDGDWRDIVGEQYQAPIQLGLCYDTNQADAQFGGTELGQIGQNIQFMANALGLGTVVCGQAPPAIDPLGIPENQEGMIVMPLGHPVSAYHFLNRPLWFSTFPRIQTSDVSLSTALDQRTEGTSFTGMLSRDELSQFLWSTYGFSPYLDRSGQDQNSIKRHRTVPSAHGYYPLRIYAITDKGIFFYQPNLLVKFNRVPVDFIGLPILTFLVKKISGDYRSEVAEASVLPSISTAPLILLPILDLDRTRPPGGDDLSDDIYRCFWYYEAGACAHNVLLEATAWNLSATIVLPRNVSALQSILQVDEDLIPLFLIPVGR
ncbi:MAG: nitroreductase family protein [Candidatus Thermoplasmatota archaeon]